MAIFFTVSRSDDQQLVLRQVEPDPAKIPTEITDFIPVIDGVDRRVRRLIKDEGRRASYMAAIDGAARSAFEGGTLAAAKVALEAIKANVVEAEGPDIRKQYLHATVALFGVVGIAALLTAGMLALMPAEMAARIPALLLKLLLTASYLLVGISLGIILLAFVRNLELRFETLGAFDAARLNPLMRLVFVGILATVFAIVLHERILVVAIVNYELNAFITKPMTAVVVGILCGFADMIVANFLSSTFDKTAAKA